MTDNPLVLTFDCGTQSVRALLVDKQGNIVGKAQKHFTPYYSDKTGWAEQHASVYRDALAHTAGELKKKCGDKWDCIIAVTTSTFRDTYVCVDKDGTPLRPIILWLDQREAECKKPLPLLSRLAFALVGMTDTINVQRKITKSNWLIENEPEMWAKTHKYISFSGFITHFLTGKLVDSVASQIGHIPFHYKTKKWKKTSDLQYGVFDVPPQKLCDLVNPGEVLGYTTKEFAEATGVKEGLPVIATGSDKGCETLGCGVVTRDKASISFGTATTIQIAVKKYMEPERFLPSYPAVMPGQYNPELQIFRGYWMLNWFKKEFAEAEVSKATELGMSAEELLNGRLHEIPAGCDGLMLQPLWSPALKSPEGRGAIIGFNGSHTKLHVYRAIVEGIGFALIDGLKNLERRSGNKIKCITVSGGGSQSAEICQITANMFGVPVKRIQTYEACGVGSSLMGFVAMKEFASVEQGISSMVHYKDTFEPDAAEHKTYKELYGVYKGLYKKLKPAYVKLRKMQK